MFSVYIRQSLIQLHTPDEMRGRVGSVSQLTISASNELGEAESGFLAALMGPVAAVVLGGAGAIVITLFWARIRSEEHTSELQSLMRISYAVFCLQKKRKYRSNCDISVQGNGQIR